MDAESRRMRETSYEGKKLSSSVQSFSDTRFAFIIIILEFVARFSSCLKELYGWKLDGRIRVLRYPKLPVDTKHLGERSKILSFLARCVYCLADSISSSVRLTIPIEQ